MRKNILKLGLVFVIIIFFALLMPKDIFAASIEKVEITVPEPVIGKKLTTDTSKIQVKTGDGQSLVINNISWFCNEYSISTNQFVGYKEVTDFSKECNNRDKYQLQLEFLLPGDSYSYSSDAIILMNGIELKKVSDYILGEVVINNVNYQSTVVTYNFEYAKPQKEISKIEITVPEPVIGKKLSTDESKIKIKDEDGESFVIDSINWYCDEYSISTNQFVGYKEVSDLSKECNNRDKYQLMLGFLVPNKYVPSSNIVVTVNGTELNTKNTEEISWGLYGDMNNDGVAVTFEFGTAKPQKEISKIEITTLIPVAGEKLNTDVSKFEVKIDGAETLEITEVEWLADDYNKLSSDIAEAGKKYNVGVYFKIPNKYTLSSNIIVTVNGEEIDVDNKEEFNYASHGDLDFDYTIVYKLMEEKEAAKEETKEEIVEEDTTEETKKDETVKEIKNPKTGDTITKSFVIFIIAVAGIALTINSIKKQNR